MKHLRQTGKTMDNPQFGLLRDALQIPLWRAAKLGVRGYRFYRTSYGDRPGVYYVLLADKALWGAINNAEPYVYPKELIAVLQTLIEGAQKLPSESGIYHTASEPLAIALSDNEQLSSAGVNLTSNNDFIVPQPKPAQRLCTNGPDSDTIVLSFDTWMDNLPRIEFFDPDNPLHTLWLSFVVVPANWFPGRINRALCVRVVKTTQIGWNLAEASPYTHQKTADCLYAALHLNPKT